MSRCGIALLREEATPDLRDEQADVVIEAMVGTDPPRRRAEPGVLREQHRHEGVVEIGRRAEGVERPFRERALGARARRAGRLARHRADVVHEELGQLLVVDRDRTRRAGRIGPSGGLLRRPESTLMTGKDHLVGSGHFPVQARAHVRNVAIAGARSVGTHLEVARVLARLTADEARLRGAHRVAAAARRVLFDVPLHRLGELVVEGDVFDDATERRRPKAAGSSS